MKFKYNGEKGNMKGVFGYDFSDHKVVEVTDAHAIGKLSNNSHFDIIEDGEPEPEAPKVDAPPIKDTPPEAPKDDHSGKVALFRIKDDGGLYSKPDKVFHCKQEAETFMEENGINPEERKLLEKD